jgi:hypothetical protein
MALDSEENGMALGIVEPRTETVAGVVWFQVGDNAGDCHSGQ